MGMKANSGLFLGTQGAMKYQLSIQMFGLKKDYGSLENFLQNPSNFGKYTPLSLYEWLKSDYEVKPLSVGSLKGVPFEKGGGFKVVYGGDKLLQYHPEGGHHKVAYYKISSGKTGIHRYDLNGKELK